MDYVGQCPQDEEMAQFLWLQKLTTCLDLQIQLTFKSKNLATKVSTLKILSLLWVRYLNVLNNKITRNILKYNKTLLSISDT